MSPTQRKPAQPAKPWIKVLAAERYEPDLDAYGLKEDNGHIQVDLDAVSRIGRYGEGWIDPAVVMADPKAQINARIWEGRFDKNGKLANDKGRRLCEVTGRLSKEELTGRYTKLRETLKIKETDWFGLGTWSNFPPSRESPLTVNYVPLIPGPATRQQYWADYWASSAKSFEAQTHSGIGRRVCNAMTQFPLGRGVRWEIPDDRARKAWETFWNANKMGSRFRSIMYDLSCFGEQFIRYFDEDDGLVVRQLDPATIYEIVSDQEDLETVYYYHQQFQTRHQLYSPPRGNKAPQGRTESGVTRYIIRQIDAEEIDHWAIHTVSGEARGRSDLFPVLGDLKRVRDLVTSKVIQADIISRVMAVLKANGTTGDISRVMGQLFPNGQPPPPGTVVGLNEATDLQPFEYTGGREVRTDFTYDELMDSVCAGVEIPRPYLGISPSAGSGSTQAAALTTVEPSVKGFEERQLLADTILHTMFDRVMKKAGINGEVKCEFIFPSIVKSDRASLLQDLATAEGMSWVGKRRTALTAAAEFDWTDYDYDAEQEAIAKEFDEADDDGGQDGTIRRPMIMATYRQEPKLDPTVKELPMEDEPMGIGMGASGTSNGSSNGTTNGSSAAAPTGRSQTATGSSRPQPRGAGGVRGKKNPASAANGLRQRMREASLDGQVRRHPQDPEFIEAAQTLAAQTEANIATLLGDVKKSKKKGKKK